MKNEKEIRGYPLTPDGCFKNEGTWSAIHSGYNPEKFLGSWLSPCNRFVIQKERGLYRLVANNIDYVKYVNLCNEHRDLEDAIEYCEKIIEINNL